MNNGVIVSFNNSALDRGVKDLRQARKRSQLPSVGRGQITLETQQRDIQEVKLIRHEHKMMEGEKDDISGTLQ